MQERDTEGFQVVKRKGQRKRSYLIIRKEEEEEESQELGEQLRQRLLDIQVEISSETFYSDLLDVLGKSPVNRLVCLGLGHFSTCPIARVQLTFIVSLTKSLEIPEVLLQDPVFTLPEIKFLESLHFNVPTDNLEGRFQTEDNQRVVYYLPHCPKSLTNNLLATNWNPQKLSNSVLICNSFQGLLLNTLDRDIVKEAGYVKRISKYTTETNLKVSERHFDSFNDTSIHLFEKERLGEINDTDFWIVSPADPTTTDLELISRDLPEKLTI